MGSGRTGGVDVAVVGGGLSGFATAMLLQAAGLTTSVFEAHTVPGGCAGFWRTKGFSFDVGATTFVDFHASGVGGQFLSDVGVEVPGERLPGYRLHLPDRKVTLWRDPTDWATERLRTLGDSPRHRAFWRLIDQLNTAFWPVVRGGGVRMPMRNPWDVLCNAALVAPQHWPLARHLRCTVGDALRHLGLRGDRALCAAVGMLLEDTVHSSVDAAPLINGALGMQIRGAGLTRFLGGARGLWKALIRRYRELGGELRLGARVDRIDPGFVVRGAWGSIGARQVVCAVPISRTAELAPMASRALRDWVLRDEAHRGGAVLVMLGVPQAEVADEPLTHHGLFQDYGAPFGNGNNMFVSVSAPGDRLSAPTGHRAVMISTHCELEDWRRLDTAAYAAKKAAIADRLIGFARRVYPGLGCAPAVREVATPRSYARFTGRPDGAVGGVRQRLDNTNLHAVPHDVGIRGLHLVGDTTWPGLGTVSCLVGARQVVNAVLRGF